MLEPACNQAGLFIPRQLSDPAKIFWSNNSDIVNSDDMSSGNYHTRLKKQLATLLIATAVAVLKGHTAEAAPLGKPLVELESHINWSAVDNAWKRIRPRWLVTTAACDEPECVAQKLLELEAHVKWKAVEGAWTKRRTGWVNDCKAATTHVEVANLLLEFEQNVRWQAVDEDWKARRDGWIGRVKGD